MLEHTELSTIKDKAHSVFMDEANLAYTKEEAGVPASSDEGTEAMLYNYALKHYKQNSSLNYLTECQIAAIYTRLRELENGCS